MDGRVAGDAAEDGMRHRIQIGGEDRLVCIVVWGKRRLLRLPRIMLLSDEISCTKIREDA